MRAIVEDRESFDCWRNSQHVEGLLSNEMAHSVPIKGLLAVSTDPVGKCRLTAIRAVPRVADSMDDSDQPSFDFDELVEQYYQPLYRFALSLARKQEDAVDLTQQTFLVLVRKHHQVRDRSKIKSWLFTTLYREYLGDVRKASRMNFVDIDSVTEGISGPREDIVRRLDAQGIMEAFAKVTESFRQPLILFYVEDLSYREIAETLNIPIGTVMSRLSRGKRELKRILHQPDSVEESSNAPLKPNLGKNSSSS